MIGIYPFAPLHDMRRALQSLDPRKRTDISPEQRKLVRDAILQSFYALRENFLIELDIDAPEHPILPAAARRRKTPGCDIVGRSKWRSPSSTTTSATRPRAVPRWRPCSGQLHAKEQAGQVAWLSISGGWAR